MTLSYDEMKKHADHNITIRTEDTFQRVVLYCKDCNARIFEEYEPVQMLRTFNPYPKSSTQGGKPKK